MKNKKQFYWAKNPKGKWELIQIKTSRNEVKVYTFGWEIDIIPSYFEELISVNIKKPKGK